MNPVMSIIDSRPHFATTKHQRFLGAICGKRADYFAHITLGNAKTI